MTDARCPEQLDGFARGGAGCSFCRVAGDSEAGCPGDVKRRLMWCHCGKQQLVARKVEPDDAVSGVASGRPGHGEIRVVVVVTQRRDDRTARHACRL